MEEPLLPKQVMLLGKALVPIHQKVFQTLQHEEIAINHIFDIGNFIAQSLDEIILAMEDLEQNVKRLMPKIMVDRFLDKWQVQSILEPITNGIETLLQHYKTIQLSKGDTYNSLAIFYLKGIYKHILREIETWLWDVIYSIDQPIAALKRKGLPIEGNVTLELTLNLSQPPEIELLNGWLRQNRYMLNGRYSSQKNGLGFFGTILAVVVGYEIGQHLFGDD